MIFSIIQKAMAWVQNIPITIVSSRTFTSPHTRVNDPIESVG